jgi:hypothetical protein
MPKFDSASMWDSRFPDLVNTVGDELFKILRHLYHYAALIDHYRFREAELGAEHRKYLEDWNVYLECRLLSYPSFDLELGIFELSFLHSVRTASLLWIDTGLWCFQTATAMVQSESSHLANFLEQSDLRLCREVCPELLLWMLVIGGCSSRKAVTRSFFASQLRILALSQHISSQKEIEKILQRFIYIDGVYTASLALLWEETLQSMIEGLELSSAIDE